MTRKDEIIQLAKDAFQCPNIEPAFLEDLETFANLIAASEREECAKVASHFSLTKQQIHPDIPYDDMNMDAQFICHASCQSIAAAIRARSKS